MLTMERARVLLVRADVEPTEEGLRSICEQVDAACWPFARLVERMQASPTCTPDALLSGLTTVLVNLCLDSLGPQHFESVLGVMHSVFNDAFARKDMH